ncbi:MAG: hypothetical protein IJS65_08665, partial [Clostridia bacterium]|nr:hypothetical protein [Clostridia bacterium]
MNKTFKYSGVFILMLLTFLFAGTCVYAEYTDVELKDDGSVVYVTDANGALLTAAYDPSSGSFKTIESLEGNKPDKDALYKIFALDAEHGWTPLCDSLSVLTLKGGDIGLSGSYDVVLIAGDTDIKGDICARYKLYILDGANVSVSGSLTFGDDSPDRYVYSTVKGGSLTVKENGALIISERTRLECETNVFLENGSELKVLSDAEFFIDDASPYVLDTAGDITVEGRFNVGDWNRHFHGRV